jgi:hypothetical protein
MTEHKSVNTNSDLMNQIPVGALEVLQVKISELERKIESNNVFTYMVIHDLKHPTESMISSL